MTFRVSSTEIVKVPLNENGIFDNGYEAKIFCERGRDGFIPYARCELDTIDEIPVLKMEFVDVGSAPKFSEAPGWVDYVDCGQVGTALDGKLVAYDYGYF